MRPREAVESWRACIVHAIRLGDADAAYRLARALVHRCRELRLLHDDTERAREALERQP